MSGFAAVLDVSEQPANRLAAVSGSTTQLVKQFFEMPSLNLQVFPERRRTLTAPSVRSVDNSKTR